MDLTNFRDLAQALKLAIPSVWATGLRFGGQVADVATEDTSALTVIKAFTREERETISSHKRGTYPYSEAPPVNSEASFLYLVEVTRNHLSEQHQERVNQARAAFMVALAALILGIVLVFAGIVCIFTISLSVGVVTAPSPLDASDTPFIAYSRKIHICPPIAYL